MESTAMSWRKSSYSSNGGGDCVEAASHNGTVMIRDTKDNARGQVHSFTGDEWRVFLVSIKAETDR